MGFIQHGKGIKNLSITNTDQWTRVRRVNRGGLGILRSGQAVHMVLCSPAGMTQGQMGKIQVSVLVCVCFNSAQVAWLSMCVLYA